MSRHKRHCRPLDVYARLFRLPLAYACSAHCTPCCQAHKFNNAMSVLHQPLYALLWCWGREGGCPIYACIYLGSMHMEEHQELVSDWDRSDRGVLTLSTHRRALLLGHLHFISMPLHLRLSCLRWHAQQS